MGSVRVPEGFNFKWEHTDERKKKERIQGEMAVEEDRQVRKVAETARWPQRWSPRQRGRAGRAGAGPCCRGRARGP